VPISNAFAKAQGREKLAEELKRLDAVRVLMVLDTYETDAEKQQEEFDNLRDNCRFFHDRGFEVGAWLWAFSMPGEHPYAYMVDLDGKPIHNGDFIPPQVCPSDENFLAFAGSYIERLVACGIDLVLFDDDLRYGDYGLRTIGCLCPNHVRAVNAALGTSFTREELAARIQTGGKNQVRDAFLAANGRAFCNFAKAMRTSADRVNPSVRMGYCCCMSAWDLDGTTPRELAYAFAGKTRPFVRLSGAPYWNPDVANAVEYTRMESEWTRDGNIELLCEGDTYPRPRTRCPAVHLEAYDTALRAAGVTDGIMKYALDYFSLADYETGYREFHERNKPLYEKIAQHFDGKRNVGVRVYEVMKKYADVEYTDPPFQAEVLDWLTRPESTRVLSYCGIPTVYGGEGVCTVAIGENARYVTADDMKRGLITDAAGAKILTARGFDVGVVSFSGQTYEAVFERFVQDDNRIYAEGVPVYGIALNPGAEILSVADVDDGNGNVPMSYRYENADGLKCLVWNFRCNFERTNVLCHYARGQQIVQAVAWFGSKLPAYAYGNPGLYLQVKTDGITVTVGVWNCSTDPALRPVIALDRTYASITFFAGNGTLNGNLVRLDEIPAYGFVGFDLQPEIDK